LSPAFLGEFLFLLIASKWLSYLPGCPASIICQTVCRIVRLDLPPQDETSFPVATGLTGKNVPSKTIGLTAHDGFLRVGGYRMKKPG